MKIGRRRLKKLRKLRQKKHPAEYAFRKSQLKAQNQITLESVLEAVQSLNEEMKAINDSRLNKIAAERGFNADDFRDSFYASGLDIDRFIELSIIIPFQALKYWGDDPMKIKQMEIKPYEHKTPFYFGWGFAL